MSTHYVGQIAPNYVHSIGDTSSNDDTYTFTVGKLDAGMAILIGDKASLIEFPSLLLPPGVSSGSVVNIRVLRNEAEEVRQRQGFDQLQEDILHTFGQMSPKPPALRLRNVTQTSVTLEWDRLFLATSSLLSLDIYRNGQRLAPIPNPLHNTSTKLSGLDVNADYTFHLVLKTTAGTFSSNIIRTRTHTINDTSGISVCFGYFQDADMLQVAKEALSKMKAKWSDRIQIDTTHYVCTDPRNSADSNAPPGSQGQGYTKAMQLSIPAVQPHWIFACHDQKKMVNISPFYLDQDPPNAATLRESINRLRGTDQPTSSPPPQESTPPLQQQQQQQPISTQPSSSSPPPSEPLPIETPPSIPEEQAQEEKEEGSVIEALASSSHPPPPLSIEEPITDQIEETIPNQTEKSQTKSTDSPSSPPQTTVQQPTLLVTSKSGLTGGPVIDLDEDEGEMDDISLGGNGPTELEQHSVSTGSI